VPHAATGLSLRVVAYERHYFVAVLLHLGEYTHSDKTGRFRDCYLQGPSGPSLHVRERSSDSGAPRNQPSKLDEVQVERLDLGQDPVQGRAIQYAGEQRVAPLQLRDH
jgi:hypothetical protein